MAIKNKSVSTIDAPEFINLEAVDVNPLMSKCQVKVFYLGKNRNGSYIDKDTAMSMAKTLRGTPIVAAWRNDRGDYGDHGDVVTIEDGEVKFSCKTVPFGFVAPNAEVWFQDYVDYDEFGNPSTRTYMMTEGYLWTGQYKELDKLVRDGAQPHSMELDDETLNGHWAEDTNTGIEFFIINDATFSKLCILGDDVEPCFEGSTVSVEDKRQYSLKESNEFTATLFSMMNDLKFALQHEGGLESMEDTNEVFEETAVVEDEVVEVEDTPVEDEVAETEFEEAPAEEEVAAEDEVAEPEPAEEPEESADEALEELEEQFSQTKAAYEALKADYESLASELDALKQFKLEVENREKDAVIAKYFMLDDEDKADVIANKSAYTIEQIEAKLALAYVNKNVDFSTVSGVAEEDEQDDPSCTFSLDEDVDVSVSGIVAALRSTNKKF